MKGVREMKELRQALETIREKGMAGATPADLKALIVQLIRAAGVISGVMALTGIITDLAAIITAAKEALRGRTIDLSGPKSRVRVSFRKPRSRTINAETRKNAESVRREIRNLRKILFMKRTMQR